jgi:hypothetical protein
VALDRVLVIDESLNKQLANELRIAADARAVEEIGPKGAKDPAVIERVLGFFHDPVLMTGDDSMPFDHANALDAVSVTVATVALYDENAALVIRWEAQDHRTQEDWQREIVHRWPHTIHEQGAGTIRRYGLNRHGQWRPRRR